MIYHERQGAITHICLVDGIEWYYDSATQTADYYSSNVVFAYIGYGTISRISGVTQPTTGMLHFWRYTDRTILQPS